MEDAEVEENLFASSDAKLHRGMCKKLCAIVCKILGIFPLIEGVRPRSRSGIQALCSLHVALDKSKSLLQHCSECSKLYLAITGESILMKFEKARCTLQESLKRVECEVPQAIGRQILEIVSELESTEFALDQTEKQIGDEVITLLQKERKFNSNSSDLSEVEVFHQAASKLGITSSRAALRERRALKKLIERAHAEDDKRKESIVAYLLHLMRKYSKLFRNEVPDDSDSQGSSPCSPTVMASLDDVSGPGGKGQPFEKQLSKLCSFNLKQHGTSLGNMPLPPEELRCPISLQLMYDPVIISSGQTYERVCIEKWFRDGHSTCPKTQQQLSDFGLTPNYCVRGLITSWCEQNGVPVPDGHPESLDLNYWRLVLSVCEATDSRSTGSIDSCNLKGVKVIPLEESGTMKALTGNDARTSEDSSPKDSDIDEFEQYKSLLVVLNDGTSITRQCKVVEQVRLLLKDDEDARIYMGANGFVTALAQFLRSALQEEDTRAQEVGAMALFNLAVNNSRNKELLLSAGVLPLLEEMIRNPETWESATALYLNLSCLDEAKPIIGSSQAVPFLIRVLQADNLGSSSCKHDALYAVYNLSSHPPNISYLLESSILDVLHSLLTGPAGPHGCMWTEKVLTLLINLASSIEGKRKIASSPGMITAFATVLESGEPAEQEKVVSCLLILCDGDNKCSNMVLQEGVIPALVMVSANGTAKGKENAQKLLKLFREQRQREPSPVRGQQHQQHHNRPDGGDDGEAVTEPKLLPRSRSKRLGRTLTSLWKNNSCTMHQSRCKSVGSGTVK